MKNSMKCIFHMHHYVLFATLSSLLFAGCDKNSLSSSSTRTAASVQPQPQTVTPQLSIGLGDGVNLNFGWSLMKANTKIRTVRIEIEPTVSITTVKSWISQARSNGFAVIATYHKATVLGSA